MNKLTLETEMIFPILKSSRAGVTSRWGAAPPFGCSKIKKKQWNIKPLFNNWLNLKHQCKHFILPFFEHLILSLECHYLFHWYFNRISFRESAFLKVRVRLKMLIFWRGMEGFSQFFLLKMQISKILLWFNFAN